jgi:hypothetical protein
MPLGGDSLPAGAPALGIDRAARQAHTDSVSDFLIGPNNHRKADSMKRRLIAAGAIAVGTLGFVPAFTGLASATPPPTPPPTQHAGCVAVLTTMLGPPGSDFASGGIVRFVATQESPPECFVPLTG